MIVNDSADYLETSLSTIRSRDIGTTDTLDLRGIRAFRRLRSKGKEHSMDCVNHSGVTATAFCQNCGKALCANCVRTAPEGRFSASRARWRGRTYQHPFVAPPAGGPNPSAAAVLGLIPGVGAMYNGQFFKGLIHVVIFVVLISITTHYGIFGLFIPAWILYQSFEAFHTAKAMRDGQPLPDPLGLNEVGNWLNLGGKPPYPPQAAGRRR